MKLNIYDRHLIESMVRLLPSPDTAAVVEQLISIGVIDTTRCKILLIREKVEALVKAGGGKIESMHITANEMCCSYEYVRKCMYYNKDINMPKRIEYAI
jgi:hypothetical protein